MIPKEYKDLKEFEEAFEIAQEMTYNEKEMEIYEYILKKERDDLNALYTAKKKGWKMGWEQGLEKGREEGIQKGIQKGKDVGKKETQIEIAKNLLDILDNETISKKTGLSIDEIEKLRG